MDPKDIAKTAFVTRQVFFCFTVIAFGLCIAPATFEKLIEFILPGVRWYICLTYLNDVIIYGGNFYASFDRLMLV